MILTEEGFLEELERATGVRPEPESAVRAYRALSGSYDVCSVEPIADGRRLGEVMRWVKPESRGLVKMALVGLAYRSEFCPQDMPTDVVAVNSATGLVSSMLAMLKGGAKDGTEPA